MSDFATLKEMGVSSPEEITGYSLRSEGLSDILKIFYKRKKGSFLPTSRKYKFGRAANTVRIDGGKQQYEETYIISPFLQKAIAELDSIVNQSKAEIDCKETLLTELDHLEKIMSNKLNSIRERVKELD